MASLYSIFFPNLVRLSQSILCSFFLLKPFEILNIITAFRYTHFLLFQAIDSNRHERENILKSDIQMLNWNPTFSFIVSSIHFPFFFFSTLPFTRPSLLMLVYVLILFASHWPLEIIQIKFFWILFFYLPWCFFWIGYSCHVSIWSVLFLR